MTYYGYVKHRGSRKTTAAGIIALVVLIGNAALALLDNDPATNPDWNALGTAAVAVGALFARDHDVTSEEAKAKP